MQTNQKVRVLTYNVFLRPPGVSNNGNDYKNERCDLIIDELDRFGIVCFQEMFGLLNLRKMKMRHKALKKGFTFQASSPSPSFFSGAIVDGGLLTLSKFPILKHEFKAFPYGILSDNLALKGILYTKIDIEGHILHLFNTHFQASYIGKEENVVSPLSIKNQSVPQKFLNQIIEQEEPSRSDLFMLVGDFNVDALYSGYPISTLNLFPDIQEMMTEYQKYIEYEALIMIFSQNNRLVRDLLKEKNDGNSPVTFGDTETDYSDQLDIPNDKPSEIILTDKQDWSSRQCLDYMMQLFLDKTNIQVQMVQYLMTV